MLMNVLYVLAVALCVFLVLATMQPSQFRVTRSKSMKTSPEAVFAQVNNLHNWEAWSPWARLDPNAKSEFAGPAEGVGAVMSWDGNQKVGTGSMTIVESKPASQIKFRMDFKKPIKGTSEVEFTFAPQGDQTMVSWSMSGQNKFINKAMSLIFNCEKMVGGQFEKGLANLQGVVEG